MGDIFISYKRKEQPKARKLADALQKKGWSVWWDPKLRAGEHFDDEIERALNNSRCVVVMWSKLSVKSRYVKDEATYALNRKKLIPIKIEEVDLPFRFEGIQTGQLLDWDGSNSFPGYLKLVDDIENILGVPPAEAENHRRKQDEEIKHKEEEQSQLEEARQKLEMERRRFVEQQRKFEDEQKRAKAARERNKSEVKRKEEKQTGKTIQKTYKNSIGIEFVLIPAGAFTMGSSTGSDNERSPHKVKISQSFYLQTTQVTQRQWKAVMGDNPSHFKEYGGDCPVESVSWDDIHDFIKQLNEIGEGNKYRLPSEAEWEYACRAESTTEFSFGDKVDMLDKYAWYRDNSGDKAHPVGRKQRNAWGLYDMHGNVWECVEDDFHDTYDGAPTDGSPWIDEPRGDYRVVRGGSWHDVARDCRSANSYGRLPGRRRYFVGFRLSRSVALGT